MRSDESEKNDLFALAALFVLALAIRLIRLFDLDIWMDESGTLIQVQHSFAGIWNLCKLDNTPPLFSWIMKIGYSLFPDENALRLFSAFLGSLTPPAAFALGKTMLDRRLAWALGIACVLSPALLYQHQIIRSYSLFSLFSCLSVIGFIRGLQTNQWKYWILTALANLLGFYTFLFMAFLIAAEVLLLLWFYRLSWQKYLRPCLAHVPVVLLMLVWAVFAMQRAREIRNDFLYGPLSQDDLVKLWVFFGTGVDFSNRYLLTFLLNLPFLLGVILCLLQMRKMICCQVGAVILIVPIVAVALISLIGPSIFSKRYFIFLLPIYMGLALTGWLSLSSQRLRRLGITTLLLIVMGAAVFYFGNYFGEHGEYGFIKAYGGKPYNGHALSRMASLIRNRIQPDEVVLHFGDSMTRSFSFFPMIYYNKRSLREYLYSRDDIKPYFNGQYLQKGDQIRSLQDLDPLPAGIWMVSLSNTELFFDDSTALGRSVHLKWLNRENLPLQLKQTGYNSSETFRLGGVTAIHYRRRMGLDLKATG